LVDILIHLGSIDMGQFEPGPSLHAIGVSICDLNHTTCDRSNDAAVEPTQAPGGLAAA